MSLSKKAKILIGGVLIVVALALGVVGYGAWSLYSSLSRFGKLTKAEIPAELQEAKVFKGPEFLTKKEFFKLEEHGILKSVFKGLEIKDEKERQRVMGGESGKGIYNFAEIKICGEEIVAVAEFGGYVFDFDGNLKREIYFEPSVTEIKILGMKTEHYRKTADNLRIIDIEGDGKCEFISHSSVDGFALFDAQGNVRRRSDEKDVEDIINGADDDKEVYVTEATVGDLDDDGNAEFMISRKNDGIRAYDKDFNEKWFQPDEFPTSDLYVLDLDGDGKTELYEHSGKGSTIRDKKTGNVLKKLELVGSQDGLLPLEDEKKKKTIGKFYINENTLTLSDLSGNARLKTQAPLSAIKARSEKQTYSSSTPIYDPGNMMRAEPVESGSYLDVESVYEPKAVWATLKKDKPKYLIVVASFIGIPRSNVYVYESNGTLVYHELLPEDAETVAVVPAADGTEGFLIGGLETIWKYAAK